MNPKHKAIEIYQMMYDTTPDILTWGSRHLTALAAAKKAVHEICLAMPTYPCDNHEVGSQRDVIDCALVFWKQVKQELDEFTTSTN